MLLIRSRSRIWRHLPAVIVAMLVVGCDGDGIPVGVTPHTNVSGTWTYSASNLSGGGLVCQIEGTRLELEQTGRSFVGIYTGGTLTCVEPVGGRVVPFGAGVVTAGEVEGNSVTFDFDTSDIRHSGEVDGRTMSGALVMRMDVGDPIGVVTLTGNFSAVRD